MWKDGFASASAVVIVSRPQRVNMQCKDDILSLLVSEVVGAVVGTVGARVGAVVGAPMIYSRSGEKL